MPTATGKRGYRIDKIEAEDVDASPKTVGDIYIDAFHSMRLGSTNGSTYGAVSYIYIPLAISGYSTLSVKWNINGGAGYDQNINFRIYGNNDGATFDGEHLWGEIARGVLPSGTVGALGFGNGDESHDPALAFAGNFTAGRYHKINIADVPYVLLYLSETTPSTGQFDNFTFIRRAL